VKARLVDDRADPCQRGGPLGRNRAAEQRHRSGRRLGQAEQHPDQRRLAGAVGAEIAEGRSARNAKVDAVDDDLVAEPLRQPLGLDNVRAL